MTEPTPRTIAPQFARPARAYAWGDPKSDPVTGKVWVDVVTQQVKADSVRHRGGQRRRALQPSYNGTAVDGGVKVDVAGFEGVLYGYSGKGVGTTGLFILATSAAATRASPTAAMCKLTYKIDKLKVGAELRYLGSQARRR